MPPPIHGGPKLPHSLLSQVGGLPKDDHGGHRARNAPPRRKELRKLQREQKKAIQHQPRNKFEASTLGFTKPDPPIPQVEGLRSQRQKSSTRQTPLPHEESAMKPASGAPKPILKLSATHKPSITSSFGVEINAKVNSANLDPTPSRKVVAQLDEDDAEIAALEKKLGLTKQGTLNKSFADDGLDLLLHNIGEDSTGAQANARKRNNDEDTAWLDMKRRRTSKLLADNVNLKHEHSRSIDSEDNNTSDLEERLGEFSKRMSNGSDRDIGAEIVDSDSPDWDQADDVVITDQAAVRVRENPYVAPIASTNFLKTQKYIPPSLRNAAAVGAEVEAMARLSRRTQGLLNRLSEANILTILNDFEKLYQENPRQHVTTILHDLLIERTRDRVSLSDTFIILHAGLIAGLYRLVGVEFGAQMVQRLVQEFDHYYELSHAAVNAESSKETLNLISLLAQLYNFQITGSSVVFDYVRQFLSTLSELHTELLLRIIRSSGPALRQDDPSALKDIVILLQKATAAAPRATAPSVRTLFMIETISDLKNNKLKSAAGAASGLDAEHIHRMRKMLGTLNARGIVRASEPLQVGLADLRDTEKKGKWWLAGASWRGRDNNVEHSTSTAGKLTSNTEEPSTLRGAEILDLVDSTPDLMHLAAAARMNTAVRRAIFVALLSASDASDAQQRLHGLRLSQSQRPEMARVLLHCAGAESAYNPYYALVARRVCADFSKMGMAFQFTLWDLFGKMEVEEENGDAISLEAVVNSARFYAVLIYSRAVRIGVLKNLDLTRLSPRLQTFVEVLLVTLLSADAKSATMSTTSLFERALDQPQLAQGLQWFLKKVVARSDLVPPGKQRDWLRRSSFAISEMLAAKLIGRDEIAEAQDQGDESDADDLT